jgi:hypothetical protein
MSDYQPQTKPDIRYILVDGALKKRTAICSYNEVTEQWVVMREQLEDTQMTVQNALDEYAAVKAQIDANVLAQKSQIDIQAADAKAEIDEKIAEIDGS